MTDSKNARLRGNVRLHGLKALLLVSSSVACALALLPAQEAFAQTKIEQMIVTAQKRSQDIQAVPASISAFSGDSLDERQVKSLADLTTATPNVTFSSQSATGVTAISIRGVSTDQITMAAEQPIAIHIDGAYQPRTSMLHVVMADLDSVEVLRGPQGTLYGRNATGGVINLITNKPTDVFEGSGTIFGGSWGRYGARGYVSGPITEGISARISGLVDRTKGYGKNLYLNQRTDGSWMYGARLAVRLEPTDDLTVDISATHTYQHTNSPAYVTSDFVGRQPLDRFGSYTNDLVGSMLAMRSAGRDVRNTSEPWRIYEDGQPEQTNRLTGITTTIGWEITPEISVKSITAWQRTNWSLFMAYDNIPTDFIRASVNEYFGNETTSRTWSQEFNINAKLWDRLDAVIGAYYLDDKLNFPGAATILPFSSPFNPNGTPLLSHSVIRSQHVKSKAVFADLTFSVLDDLRLLGGIRRTLDYNDTILGIGTTNLYTGALIGADCGVRVPNVRPALDAHSTTFRAGAQYDFTPDIMGYVQWQSGFKAGGWNFSACNNSFKPENIYAWEFGLKTTLFNGSTTLNVSYFDYRYKNLQVSRVVPANPPSQPTAMSLLDNAGSASIKGADIELNTYPTDDIRVDVGVGILDTKYGSMIAVNPNLAGTPIMNIAGNQLARAPKLTFNAGVEHTMNIGDLGELKSRAEFKYSSRIFYSAFNEHFSHQDGYSLWNVFFTFTPADCENLQVQAYVRNLTNKAYRQGAFPSGTLWSAKGRWNTPRTFGAEVTAKF